MAYKRGVTRTSDLLPSRVAKKIRRKDLTENPQNDRSVKVPENQLDEAIMNTPLSEAFSSSIISTSAKANGVEISPLDPCVGECCLVEIPPNAKPKDRFRVVWPSGGGEPSAKRVFEIVCPDFLNESQSRRKDSKKFLRVVPPFFKNKPPTRQSSRQIVARISEKNKDYLKKPAREKNEIVEKSSSILENSKNSEKRSRRINKSNKKPLSSPQSLLKSSKASPLNKQLDNKCEQKKRSRVGEEYQVSKLPMANAVLSQKDADEKSYLKVWDPVKAKEASMPDNDVDGYLDSLSSCTKTLGMLSLHNADYRVDLASKELRALLSEEDIEVQGEPLSEQQAKLFKQLMKERPKDFNEISVKVGVSVSSCLVHYYRFFKRDKDYREVKKTLEGSSECVICKEGGVLILCFGCHNAYHPSCHDPPFSLMSVSRGDWFCQKCKRT